MLTGGSECPGLTAFSRRPPQRAPAPPPCLSPACLSSPLTLAPGLEQLRNLQHLDVAYNLLEEHRALSPLWLLAELRKVDWGLQRPGSPLCPPPPRPMWMWPVPVFPRGGSGPL